jgi:Predicted Peptidoglycan domain
MYINTSSIRELAFTAGLVRGSKGNAVKRLQEWLCLHGHSIVIDGDFGPATLAALRSYQIAQATKPANVLSQTLWDKLSKPLHDALSEPIAQAGFSATCKAVAAAHLAAHPREVGGDNRGPWVRVYTGGHDGAEWLWCAGFVSFVLKQTGFLLGSKPPINGSLSCDSLAAQARAAERFIPGKTVLAEASVAQRLGECGIFLARRTPDDWTHTGFAFNFTRETFETIEGNTNDDGSANGYEVCRRIRKVSADYDFIALD